MQGLEGFTYLFFSLAVSVIFILRPTHSALIYGTSLLGYYGINYIMDIEGRVMYSNFINTSSVIITACFISTVLQNSYIRDFLKQKVIEEQKRKLEKMLLLDPMTGLYNRRGLNDRLKEYYNTAKVKDSFLAVFMFDIDYFKGVNDTYGHSKGDEIIRIISDQIIKLSDEYGGVGCRYGGDEFCIIIPDISDIEAKLIYEEFKTRILKLEIENTTSKINILSVSGGFSTKKASDDRLPWDLIMEADRALYKAKRARY